MYKKFITLVASFAIIISCSNLFAQAAPATPPADGEYRSTGAVNFSSAANWETALGGSWSAAATPPDGSKTITIQIGTTLTVDQNVVVTGYIKNAGVITYVAATTTVGATVTSGSNVITLPAANASIVVGQALTSSTGFPAGIKVTGVAGTSVTVSQTASSSGSSNFS